jgi:hypothetical protein
VLVESYGYRPVYLVWIDGDELAVAVPMMETRGLLSSRRGVSLPFSDYCEPLISGKAEPSEVVACVLSHAEKVGWKTVAIRGGKRYLGGAVPSCCCYTHEVVFPDDEEGMLSGFSSSTRRNIRKATREGVHTGIHNSSDAVREFYRLNCLTRRAHGLPPQPYTFFRKVHEHIISKGLGMVVLATYEGRTIAGAVYFRYGESALYKYGASDRRYQRVRPNDIVMWEGIKWFHRNGYAGMSLGRTEIENGGLRRFKKGWTSKEETLYYYRYNVPEARFVSERSRVRGLHNSIFRRMPISLLRIAGKLLYRYAA